MVEVASSGAELTRLALCLASGGSLAGARAVAESTNASARVQAILKAAVLPAQLGDAEFQGGLQVYQQIAQSFIGSIRPRSLFYQAAAVGIPVPLHSGIVVAALIPAADIDEQTLIPVGQASLEQRVIEARTTGAVVVVSSELAEAADGAAFALLRGELEIGVIAALDRAFWAIAVDGIIPDAATASPLADVRSLLSAVLESGSAGSFMWAASPSAGIAIATASSGGALLFPTAAPTGASRLLGSPMLVSAAVPDGSLALFNLSDFAMNAGTLVVDRSDQAALQLRDDPVLGAASLVSLWQNNLSAIRAISRFGCERIRDGAAAVLTGVPAAWSA